MPYLASFSVSIRVDGRRYAELARALQFSSGSYYSLYKRLVEEAVARGELPSRADPRDVTDMFGLISFGLTMLTVESPGDVTGWQSARSTSCSAASCPPPSLRRARSRTGGRLRIRWSSQADEVTIQLRAESPISKHHCVLARYRHGCATLIGCRDDTAPRGWTVRTRRAHARRRALGRSVSQQGCGAPSKKDGGMEQRLLRNDDFSLDAEQVALRETFAAFFAKECSATVVRAA